MAKDSSKTKRWEKLKAGLKKAGKIFVYCAVPVLLFSGLVACAIYCPPALVAILVGFIVWGGVLHYRDQRRQEKTFARANRNIDSDPREEDSDPARRSGSYVVLASPPPSMTVASDEPPKDASSPLAEKHQVISSSNLADARNTLNT